MKQVIKKIMMVVFTMLLLFISTNVYAKTAKAKEETVRIRKEASTDSSIIALISQNEEVEILEETGDWYQVKYNSYTGYVRKDMLEVETANETQNQTSTTTTNQESESQNETTEDKTEQEENTTSENNTSTIEKNESSEENKQNSETISEKSEENKLQKGYTGKLTSKLDLKLVPLINSSVIKTLDENTQITITDIMNKWCYVETENECGWTLLSKVETEEKGEQEEKNQEKEQEQEKENDEEETKETNNQEVEKEKKKENTEIIKYVSAETLNVRESADNEAKIISQLTLNTKVTVLEQINSTWAKITAKGKTGYVANKYLSDQKVDITSRSEEINRQENSTEKEETKGEQQESKQETSSSSNQKTQGTSGADIVSFAKKYLGYHYVAGGASPSTGFDCSGFTTYVYKNFGITLSRSSGAQASNGTAVSKPNLQQGDLVIFNNSSNSAIGHVGIYIGGNTFIHAANSQKGVITTSLSDNYYSPRFVTGRRVIP